MCFRSVRPKAPTSGWAVKNHVSPKRDGRDKPGHDKSKSEIAVEMLLRQRHAALDQHFGHGVDHRRRAGEIPFELRQLMPVRFAHDLMDEAGTAGPGRIVLRDRRMEM